MTLPILVQSHTEDRLPRLSPKRNRGCDDFGSGAGSEGTSLPLRQRVSAQHDCAMARQVDHNRTALLHGNTMPERLEAAWRYSGVMKKDLAKRVGISPTALREWFNGGSKPQHDNLLRFCDATGVSYDWIRTGIGSPVGAVPERKSGPVDVSSLEAFLRTPAGMGATGAEIERLMGVLRLLGGAITVEGWEAQLGIVRLATKVEVERPDPRTGDLGGYTAVPDDDE
jgi:transcriptional regulator with XRE-family HTH domain